MNKRIQELYKEAYGYFPCPMGEPETEKFAELIVAECCQVLGKETIRHDGYGYNQHALYQKIREHFGVADVDR